MYELTLTYAERQAIDWIGNRYFHGIELFALLWTDSKTSVPIDFWESEIDITFSLPEYVAWQIAEGIESENRELACFGPELREKLLTFIDSIV